MARTRKPTAVLEKNGAYKHDPSRREARKREPVPSGPLGAPPARFTEVQKQVWYELAIQVPEGVLTIADRMAADLYCSLVARHYGGDKEKDGSIRPPERLKASEYGLILQLLSRFGLTPADRSRIKATPNDKEEEKEDTFDRLAKEGRGRGGGSTVKQ
jgi:phage terminase small subunit